MTNRASSRRKAVPVYVGAALLVVFFLAPSTASAAEWILGGWLEQLSGPGPFKTTAGVIEIEFLCFGEIDGFSTALDNNDDGLSKFRRKLRLNLPRRGGIGGIGLGCNFLDPTKPRLEFGFSRGSLEAKENPLTYNPPLNADQKRVELRIWTITADVRVNQVLDIGMALGKATFEGQPFGEFDRVVFEPIRVTLRPLMALPKRNTALEVLTLKFGAVRFNGGFADVDFKAQPDTFNARGEIDWTFGIGLDFGALLWARGY
jgi:hypothetical protein